MGFKRPMIEALFESEEEIEDVNHAAELLIPRSNGLWAHKFSKTPSHSCARYEMGMRWIIHKRKTDIFLRYLLT